METKIIEKILQDLTIKPIGIQGVALVSHQGQLITVPVGLDENSVLITSGTMLYAAQTIQTEFHWQNLEMISFKDKEGHIILACCSLEIYLLVKAGTVITGLLEGEISRTVKKLREEIQRESDQEVGEQTTAEALPQVVPADLVQMAQDLINSYPDFVANVKDINPKFSNPNMLQLGQEVGKGLIEQGKIEQISPKNIPLALKKLIIPAIDPFVIADAQGNELKIHANPFCLNQTSDEPSCYFLRGMIEGLLQSVSNLPEFTVDETTCKATGADSCTFTIKAISHYRR
jgi:predicted hydrocarbon binding protein/predicted regulator of Ras-like GTPase activity (Roadblock/LC7/MglB family)